MTEEKIDVFEVWRLVRQASKLLSQAEEIRTRLFEMILNHINELDPYDLAILIICLQDLKKFTLALEKTSAVKQYCSIFYAHSRSLPEVE